jgi:hypothetical protein
MPKKLRALPCLLFKSTRSKQLKRSSSGRAELSQKPLSAFQVASGFTSVTPPAMNSPPCSRTDNEQARAADQTMDEVFAHHQQQWISKPEFTSPLVDHLPTSTTVPSPRDVLGDDIGAPRVLHYYADILKYYRVLADKSPRVKIIPTVKPRKGAKPCWSSTGRTWRSWPTHAESASRRRARSSPKPSRCTSSWEGCTVRKLGRLRC